MIAALFFLAATAHARPARVAVLGGASGEEKGARNFFVDDLKAFRKGLVAHGWSVHAAIGAKKNLLPGSVPATNQHLLSAAGSALAQAKKDDEILLVFHSHGREKESVWGQKSHSIVSEDVDPGFDLDVLEPDLKRATAAGAKVALVDLSCYSGTTQALPGPSCTVTLASPRYISLCSGRPEERLFTSLFLRLPAKPTSLEAQFRQARRGDRESVNLPQISSLATPAAEGWSAFLDAVDPLDTFDELKNIQPGAKPFAPATLLGPLDAWIQAHPAPALQPLRASIAKKLDEVLAVRARIEAAMPRLAADYDVKSLTITPSGRGPLPLAPASLDELLDAPEDVTDAERNLAIALIPMRMDLERKFVHELEDFAARRKDMDELTIRLERAAGELFSIERDFYDAAHGSPPQGACADFTL